MQFDDRLATVLRMQAGNERAANTQFRQLLDLVGSAPEGADGTLLGQAYKRLEALSSGIGAQERGAMIREPGMRLRNLELVAFLTSQEMPVASAAIATARLTEDQWDILIPILAIPVRSLLRHRKDLPPRAMDLLTRLGVGDLVLSDPGGNEPQALQQAGAQEVEQVYDLDPALEIGENEAQGIGAIVRRIEAFRRAREDSSAAAGTDAPRLPLGEQHDDVVWLPGNSFDFVTDAEGRIVWTDPGFAPMTVGILLANEQPDAPAKIGAQAIAAFRHRQPLHAVQATLEGAPSIEGAWQIDALPDFTVPGGRFTGYRGRMRRPAEPTQALASTAEDSMADRMRQVLHELRTPVNAIQGFAEIIQQQLFGPTPNEYRALAASIVGDAARMLAGFDELDRLVKLEAGALELDEGSCDFAAIVAATVSQLDAVLRKRTAGFEFTAPQGPCMVALSRGDADALAWRFLATLAGVTTASEALQIDLAQDGKSVTLTVDLPISLASRSDVFSSAAPAQAQSVTAGMFGAGFTLRLARAEARAVGGDLSNGEDQLRLRLPLFLGKSGINANNDMDLDSRMSDTA